MQGQTTDAAPAKSLTKPSHADVSACVHGYPAAVSASTMRQSASEATLSDIDGVGLLRYTHCAAPDVIRSAQAVVRDAFGSRLVLLSGAEAGSPSSSGPTGLRQRSW
jgi:hypothetical protein